MRFVIFGLTVSSSWGNGHATLWRGLCRALGRSGHTVTFFERDVPYYAQHRDLVRPSDFNLQLYENWDSVKRQARQAVDNADCAMVTSYCPDGCAAADLVLCAAALRTFYDLDTPVTLNTLERQGEVSYLPKGGLTEFDLVLSYTGGEALNELKLQLGARTVAALYGSVDPSIHKRVAPSSQYCSDFSYLGTYAADRQAQLENLFLEAARRCPDRKFCIAGAQYPQEFPWTQNVYFVRHLPPPEHPAFYSSSKLTLNVTRAAMAKMGYCPSGRLFEAAACGTPIVSDWWEGLEQFFGPDEILTARRTDDVTEALNLEEGELERLAQRARERVLAEHTADKRAAELVSLVEAEA
jgi:spore maturation protein CgeB